MLGLRLDSELLRTSTIRLFERAAVPFLGEVVAVVGRSLSDTIVNPARMGFSLMEGGQTGRGKAERLISYLGVLLRDFPALRSCSEAW